MARAGGCVGLVPAQRAGDDLVLQPRRHRSGAVVGRTLSLSVRLLGAADFRRHAALVLQHACLAGRPRGRSALAPPRAGGGDAIARPPRPRRRVRPLACGRCPGDAMAGRLRHRLPRPRPARWLRRAAPADEPSLCGAEAGGAAQCVWRRRVRFRGISLAGH